ncbi:MAG: hypothetical protein Kow00124_23590 [Anaerolineae bacterium]
MRRPRTSTVIMLVLAVLAAASLACSQRVDNDTPAPVTPPGEAEIDPTAEALGDEVEALLDDLNRLNREADNMDDLP